MECTALLARVNAAVHAFSAGAEASDGITMLAVRRVSQPFAAPESAVAGPDGSVRRPRGARGRTGAADRRRHGTQQGVHTMRELLAATGNRHKVIEIRDILRPLGIHVLGAADVGGIPEVLEDGATFAENAAKKAREIAAATGRWVLADDSGLCVDALGGAPGVQSARFAGEPSDDKRNVAKLLQALAGVRQRRARFECVVAIAGPHGVSGTACGAVHGRIIAEPRGANGFGYDPVFVPDGHDRTFAELAAAVKNGMSHRAAALFAARQAGLFESVPDTAAGRASGEGDAR